MFEKHIGNIYHHDILGDFIIESKIEDSVYYPNTLKKMLITFYLFYSKDNDFYFCPSFRYSIDEFRDILRSLEERNYYVDQDHREMTSINNEVKLEEAIRKKPVLFFKKLNSHLDESKLEELEIKVYKKPILQKITSDYKLEEIDRYFNLVIGKAGVGKTYFIKKFVDNSNKNIAIVAPTAMAAINTGGVTINSFFKLPLNVFDPNDSELINISSKYSSIDYLIIDEISMVKSYQLDAIDKIMRANNDKTKPFGGKKILAFGDIFQLGPISSDDQEANQFMQKHYNGSYWFFDAKVFNHVMEEAPFEIPITIMTESKRHSDKIFISFLDVIRRGKAVNDIELQRFNNLSKTINENNLKEETIYLCQRNNQANNINHEKLNHLESDEKIYKATHNNWPENEASYPNELQLHLKLEAEIIFIKNDVNKIKKFYNGEKGVIHSLDDNKIVVKKINGNIIDVEPVIWEKYKYTYNSELDKLTKIVTATFTQLPIRLGWAITIHKSQGMTLNHISLDLSESMFQEGMLYTALSRVKKANDIYISKGILNESILQSQDSRVKDFVIKRGIEKI